MYIMKRGLKTFARSVKEGDMDKAREMYDKIVQGKMDDDIWEGYKTALKGMIEALDSGDDLTLSRQISDGKYTREGLKDMKREMKSRATQEFRSGEEIGFNRAWVDVLKVLLE